MRTNTVRGYPIRLAIVFAALSAAGLSRASAETYDIEEIEDRIHDLVNAERKAKGIAPLLTDGRLTAVARAHTADMESRGFYAHEDPEGLRSSERIARAYPGLSFLGVAENINRIEPVSPDRMRESQLAERFVQSWMNSPAHRENLLDPEFSHTGVGISVRGGRAMATQVFGTLLAEAIDSKLSGHTGATARIRFRYLGVAPRKRLTVFMEFADRRSRYYVSDRVYYTGSAPLSPRWESEDEFSVLVPCELGPGVYRVYLGLGRAHSRRATEIECGDRSSPRRSRR